MKISTLAMSAIGVAALACTPARKQPASRSVRIDATEVTSPALALSPDGQSLFFTALGHLFRVPVDGGAAAQLTFGAFYDSDPALSPDGQRVAFTSNRDGSGSNVFVLDLATSRVMQVSHDAESGRAAWSPDGQTIAYARNIPREEHPLEQLPGFRDTGLRELRTVPARGGASTAVGGPQAIETVFYLRDGRLAWSVRELGPGTMMGPSIPRSHIEARAPDASTAVLATAPGDLGRVIPGPEGNGVYGVGGGGIRWIPFGSPPQEGTAAPSVRIQENAARLALTRDGSTVYFSDRGQLWRAKLPAGEPQRIPFTATITAEVQPQVDKPWHAPPVVSGAATMRPVLAPRLSPDGTALVVMAGGLLFEQPLAGGGAAHQLFATHAFERDPAYSPDGRKLA